jgi:hypothetical protein
MCTNAWLNDAVKVATCLARTNPRRLPRYRCLAGGGTQEAVSGKRATLTSASEVRGCECEILREERFGEETDDYATPRMAGVSDSNDFFCS